VPCPCASPPRPIRWSDQGYSYLSPTGEWLIANGVDPYTWNPDSLDRSGLLAEDLWTRRQKTTLTSAYATGRFLLAEPLNLIAGTRLDWYDFTNVQRQGSWSREREFSEKAHATPYAALTYDINKTYSAYASYTSIFRPQDFLDVSGSMLAPVEGRNFELGLKGSYLDERVNLAVAVFKTTQDNLPQAIADINSCTVKTNCYRSVGKVRSKGLDVDISGEILPRLNAGLGYTFTQAEIASDSTEGAKGAPYASYTPRHQLKLSAMYHLGGELGAWRVGGGLRYQSRTTSESLTSAEGQALKAALLDVSRLLAQAIVRDGEGATKFITIKVEGGKTEVECRLVAYSIAHSPLVKTAFFASDPNLGRILAAVGYASIDDLDQTKIDLYLNDVHVAVNGGRNPAYQEEDGQRVMKQQEIIVRVLLGRGEAEQTVWTCDLSHDYVSINADYRS